MFGCLQKTAPPVNLPNVEKTMNAYAGASSDEDDGDEYENDGHNHNEYSSEDEEEDTHDQIRPRKLDHQLEWDDAAIEYGPKKV